MSDSQRSDDRAPRSGAGDAARTQPIPRISREKRPRTVADALREARQAPVESTSPAPQRRPGPARPAGKGGAEESSTPEQSAPASKAPESAAKPAAPARRKPEPAPASEKAQPKKSEPSKPAAAAESAAPAASDIKKPSEPSSVARAEAERARARSSAPAATSGTKPAARETAPTAADYARTTGGSADSTSVMPAVKDEPRATSAKTETSRKASKSDPAPTPAPVTSGSGRQAKLRLTFIEPWSVTRLAFVVSVALMIVAVVAVTIFWVVLEITGIWGSLNDTVLNVLSDSEGSFDLTDYLGLGRLVGLTLVLSAVNVVLMTAVATIGAHLYNLFAQLLGGIEVTFTDD